MEIVAVDFREGHPHNIFAQDDDGDIDMYDVEYCRRDACYYAHSSGGGDVYFHNPYWAAPGIVVKEYSAARPLESMPSPFTVEQMLSIVMDSDDVFCKWCGECQDYIPTDDHCVHIWWCDECDYWSVPDERCEHPEPF